MYYYLLFVAVMPALVYVDYLCYKKRMAKFMETQPDFASNQSNYDGLLQKMCRSQKRTSVLVCVVLCFAALILGVVLIYSTSQVV